MRLLFATLTFVEVVAALAYVFVQRTRRVYPGFSLWTAAEMCAAASYLLFALRGAVPDVVSVLVGNTCLTLAAVVRLDGTSRFLSGNPVARWWYGFPALTLVVASVLLFGRDSAVGRMAAAAVLAGIPSFGLAALVVRRRDPLQPLFSGVIAAVATGFGLVLLVRAAAAVVTPGFHLLLDTPLQQALLIAALVLHVALLVALLMLNAARLEADLKAALADVKTLSGLLPICAHCKKVRDDAGYWTRIEEYVGRHTEAQFSHGVCPECARLYYGDILDG